MVSMKIMGSLILGSYLAIVAFAQENCISDYNETNCFISTCCTGNTCDWSVPSALARKKRCLKDCVDDTTCAEFRSGTKCDTAFGVCRYTCTDSTNCGGDGFCSTSNNLLLTAGLCYPCANGESVCARIEPEYCCSGTCNDGGICAPNAGVSLFDRTFSPKLLVGFAVLMASAYFL